MGQLRKLLFTLFFALIGVIVYSGVEDKHLLPTVSDPVRIHSTHLGEDLTHLYLEAIRGAKQSILLTTYTFKDERVMSALNQKVKEGVSVTVVLEKKAGQQARRFLSNGIKFIERKVSGISHRKIVIIDETLVLLGSANITKASLRHYGNLVTSFYSPDFGRWLKEEIEKGKTSFHEGKTFHIGDQNVEVWLTPSHEGVLRIKELLKGAKQSIDVAMFTWTRLDFAEQIKQKKKEGVTISIVIDAQSASGASSEVVRFLEESEIDVRLFRSDILLHDKMAWIDGETLINGSANWTHSAFTKNEDCYIVLNGLSEKNKLALNRIWMSLMKESQPQ